MNLDHDIQEGNVQMLLLVEDSIRFYSSILPNLYNYILAQSKRFLPKHSTDMLQRYVCADVLRLCWRATMKKRWRYTASIQTTYWAL